MNYDKVKRISGCGALYAVLWGISLLCACSHAPLAGSDGGGSRGGNPVVVGTIAVPDGAAACNIRVSLIPEAFDPMTDTLSRLFSTDTTDSLGSFAITAPDSGFYNIEAKGILGGARLIRFNVKTVRDSIRVLPVDTLRGPGKIKIPVAKENYGADGYMYMPGTSIAVGLADVRDTVSLDSVPAGTFPVLYYAQIGDTRRKVIRHDIAVQPDETTLIENPEWSYYGRIRLNTTSAGASVSGDVYDFPVLIRLNTGNFDFAQVRNNGGDIMFAGSGNAPLPFEIERWDPAAGRAEIWVKIDTVFGNNDKQFITMYWGASTIDSTGSYPGSAISRSNGAAVFDTANGFQGAWHFGEAAKDTLRDATDNRHHGVSPDSARPPVAEGIIGACRYFDGKGDFVVMPNTASGTLDFPQNGAYSVSAWVMADTFNESQQTLVSKDKYQYFLWLSSASWQFCEYRDRAGWEVSAQPASVGKWVLLTGVRDGAKQYLYVDGEPADSVVLKPFADPRSAAGDLIIGRAHEFATAPNLQAGYCSFSGGIDEVRIDNTARSADWIKLCYMNQRIDDRLIIFK